MAPRVQPSSEQAFGETEGRSILRAVNRAGRFRKSELALAFEELDGLIEYTRGWPLSQTGHGPRPRTGGATSGPASETAAAADASGETYPRPTSPSNLFQAMGGTTDPSQITEARAWISPRSTAFCLNRAQTGAGSRLRSALLCWRCGGPDARVSFALDPLRPTFARRS